MLGTATRLKVRTMGVPNEAPLEYRPTHPGKILCEDFVLDWRFTHAHN